MLDAAQRPMTCDDFYKNPIETADEAAQSSRAHAMPDDAAIPELVADAERDQVRAPDGRDWRDAGDLALETA